MRSFSITRRAALLGAAAFGASFALSAPARARNGQVVVGTWGGDYGKLLTSNVAPLLEAATGDKMVLDVANDSARITKMATSARVGAGEMDVTCLGNADMAAVAKQGLLKPVAELDIPNLANVFEAFRTSYSVPHIYSGLVIVYDRSQVDKAPTSVADLWTSTYKGAVGFSDILPDYTTMAASLAFGGSMTNYGPGRDALDRLKADGGVKIYASNEAIANAFNAKEIKATLMWKARAAQWQDAGLALAAVAPSEGAIPITFDLAATSFATNLKGSGATLNAILDPQVQLASVKAMGYLPTVSNAAVPEDVQVRLGFTQAERDKMVFVDYAYLAAERERLLTWWNQSFKS